MSFYENQDRARRKTGILIIYFVLAIALIIVAVNLAVYAALFFSGSMRINMIEWLKTPASWSIAGVTLGVIVCGSLFRAIQLRDGGASIARLVGGRRISFDTNDPLEKKLLNVTEEMSIASGMRIPQVYMLDHEQGINAFVAGSTPNETVLVVTRGALEQLSRDELQGVIGHEFSHILNGDIRINIRLIAVLAGILLIGQIGELLMRNASHSRSRTYSRSGSWALLGVGLWAVGYIGLFFGRLIKAAISRQREFLADASSVQFTRNPFSIGGALYKIGYGSGSLLTSSHAEEVGHMCFGETLRVGFSKLLATHPPIDDRITAIDPTLKPRLKARARKAAAEAPAAETPVAAMGFSNGEAALDQASMKVDPVAVKASVGTVRPEQTAMAQQIHQAIPEKLLANAHHPLLAESVIYALILTTMKSLDEALALLEENCSPACVEQVKVNYEALMNTAMTIRLPLLDMVTATLEELNQEQKNKVIVLATSFVHLDNRFTLLEFVYLFLVKKYLAPKVKKHQGTYNSFSKVADALTIVMRAMVRVTGEGKASQRQLLQQSLSMFSLNSENVPLTMPSLNDLTKALQQLSRLSPLLKQPVVDTCVDCVIQDGTVKPLEVVLLRAVCEALDCPMPPIVPQHLVAVS